MRDRIEFFANNVPHWDGIDIYLRHNATERHLQDMHRLVFDGK